MSKNISEIDTGVVLPDNGIISTEWAREQLERSDAFSKELMYFGKGSVFFTLKSSLGKDGYAQSVKDLDYTVETAEVYINYLQKRIVLEAIKTKYYVAISLSAAEFIPDSIEDALALCDIVVARFGKITKDNLVKALEATGKAVNKLSTAALSVEKLKTKALNDWLLSEHQMSEEDILDANKLHPEGLKEFTEKMTQAYFLLEDWKEFYSIIAKPIHDSENMKALRFLADIQDASKSIEDYLSAEKANKVLSNLKAKFEAEVYPEISFKEASEGKE